MHKQFNDDEAFWEMRRQATITELSGKDLGLFNDFLQRKGGLSSSEPGDIRDLELADDAVIRTNSMIKSLREKHDDPLAYFNAALSTIDARKQSSQHKQVVGPGNYATSIKFFTDKYLSMPKYDAEQPVIKTHVDRWMKGFLATAKKDTPNFVEMTNIYFAIRELPTGTFDVRYTPAILKHTLEQLPAFGNNTTNGNNTLSVLMGAMRKLDVSTTGEAAATTIDLALRKGKKFETTRDCMQTLEAIAHLPATTAANRSFASFLAVRNQLERAFTIEDCKLANEHLLQISDAVIDDPRLVQAAQQLVHYNANRAANLYEQHRQRGDLVTSRLQHMHRTLQVVGAQVSRI